MLVEHLIDRTVVVACFYRSFASGILFGEFRKTVAWQVNLVPQVAVVINEYEKFC